VGVSVNDDEISPPLLLAGHIPGYAPVGNPRYISNNRPFEKRETRRPRPKRLRLVWSGTPRVL
jgi:hypothetical protein